MKGYYTFLPLEYKNTLIFSNRWSISMYAIKSSRVALPLHEANVG
jgi:hypothetical protein